MRNWRVIGIVMILVVLVDLYVFQAVKAVSQNASSGKRTLIFGLYWGLSITALIIFALLPLITDPAWQKAKNYVFFTIIAFFFAKLLAAVFFLIDDLRRRAMTPYQALLRAAHAAGPLRDVQHIVQTDAETNQLVRMDLNLEGFYLTAKDRHFGDAGHCEQPWTNCPIGRGSQLHQ